MEFFLVRHGEAKSEHDDPRRPLSDQGRKQVGEVARAVAAKQIRVRAILHSDKLRAKETAEILAGALLPRDGIRRMQGLSPEDDPWVARGELEAAAEPLMLVGHLPHLGRLASLLLTGDAERGVVDFRPATVVCLSRSGEEWEIRWIVSPETA